jgi:ubiquitin-protein ligase
MTHWNGTIIGPGHVRRLAHWRRSKLTPEQTVHENRIYSLSIECGEDYPDRPPTIRFISRVNVPFVNQTSGEVDPLRLAVLAHWNRNNTLETILVEMRKYVSSIYHPMCVINHHTERWPRPVIVNYRSHQRVQHSDRCINAWIAFLRLNCNKHLPPIDVARLELCYQRCFQPVENPTNSDKSILIII